MDRLCGFLAKHVGAGNVAMFENLSVLLDENEEDSLFDHCLKLKSLSIIDPW